VRNKSLGGDVKMSCVDASTAVQDARRWSEFMLQRKFRGPGDTIERAAHEAEQSWGAPASIMLRLRYKRDLSDMLLSNWLRLKHAYEAACTQAERASEHQKELARAAGIDEANSRLAKLATAVAGSEHKAPLNGRGRG
jgi:hypothetical protein